MNMTPKYIFSVAAFLCIASFSLPVAAQEATPAEPPIPAVAPEPVAQTLKIPQRPEDMAPLVFSVWEQKAIEDARNARGLVRPPTEAELMRDLKLDEAEKVKPPPEKRYVSLGGIIYNSKDDWAIWLNGSRVTPDALPKEAIDLVVTKEFIDIKWLDDYTNRIFPIRLRPHQRFNVDMRIFLPGQP